VDHDPRKTEPARLRTILRQPVARLGACAAAQYQRREAEHPAVPAQPLVAVLPGDTPAAGRAAGFLLSTLSADPAALGAVGVDGEGRVQPLQLALTRSAAEQLLAAARPGRGAGASARALVTTLGEGLRRVPLSPELHADIDTTADLERWQRRSPRTGGSGSVI